MEDENLRYRRELGNFQEKFRQQERLHEAWKSELATEKAANVALQKALGSANDQLQRLNDQLKRLEEDRSKAINVAKQLHRQVNRLKRRNSRLEQGFMGAESGRHSNFGNLITSGGVDSH